MIEKMKFLSITGPRSEFDRVVGQYLDKYEIHLEHALTELSSVKDLKPFVEINPHKELLLKAEELKNKLDSVSITHKIEMTPDSAAKIISDTIASLEALNEKKIALKAARNHLRDLMEQINPFRHLDYDIEKILNFKHIKFRFGKISHEYYNTFSKYVYDNLTTLFLECERDRDYIWGLYFVPVPLAQKVDAIYSSLHFERLYIPSEYEGTPEEAYNSILKRHDDLVSQLKDINQLIKEELNAKADDILNAYETLHVFSTNFDVRKLAACTRKTDNDAFYFILCGWIEEKYAPEFLKEIEEDPVLYCLSEDEHESVTTKTPTKLKNIKLFKPFELFIKMYGTPNYNEIDPTSFLAITYSLIFGIMFGDIGQGLCLTIGGFLLYKWKKMNLAAIIACAGIFSTIFGFMYGSIFGFENILHHYWLNPREKVTTILLTAVGFGVILIIIAIILNIINSLKEKDYEKAFLSHNGVVGLVFYGAAIGCGVLIATGHTLPGVGILIIFFAIPILLLFFKEPLSRYLEKKKELFPSGKGMFAVEAFFELFEIILSYVTNSISFVRVGAFAISHASMMGVVMLLSGAETGKANIPVIILGNLFVMGMEGLIVGIQVLRLEYYEMFSRFYRGSGKEFKPYNKK